MMKTKWLESCAAAALGLAMVCATPASANLLSNPGFEGAPIAAGPPPFTGRWEPFAGPGTAASFTSTVMPRTGLQHLELAITATPASFAGAFQDVTGLTAGDAVTFSGWAKDVGIDAGGTEIRIEWRNFAGDFEVSRTANLVPVLSGVYTQFSLPSVVPVGADTARLVYAIQSFGAGPDQNIFVDDLDFVPEPASLTLLSLGGLMMAGRRRR